MTEAKLIEQIQNPDMKQKDVAEGYRALLRSPGWRKIDWSKVNGAILERWSFYGLDRIKKHAWESNTFKPRKSRAKGAGR